MAGVPSDLSQSQRDAIGRQLAPDFDALTRILDSASSSMQKRSALPFDVDAAATGGCPGTCVTGIAQGIVYEISCTLRGVIGVVGLGTFAPHLPQTHAQL